MDAGHVAAWASEILSFPEKLSKEVIHLKEDQLLIPYRPDGWNIRQVVHHCADSHMNSFIRLKLALTEDNPTIKPYFEDRWGKMHDNSTMPLEPTLSLLKNLHFRWVYLLRSLPEKEFARKFFHPEHQDHVSLGEHTAFYAWHGRHHLAHITSLKARMKWE